MTLMGSSCVRSLAGFWPAFDRLWNARHTLALADDRRVYAWGNPKAAWAHVRGCARLESFSE
jgi:hypothetical protein